MILTCPSCETRYSVDPGSLLPAGRTVRCANCGHSWTERPPGDMPKSVEVPAEEPPEEEEEDDFEVPSIEDVAVQADRPTRTFAAPQKRAMGGIIARSSFAAAVLLLLGGGFFLRGAIMEVWPPSTKLYQLAGLAPLETYALALLNVAPAQEVDGNNNVVIVVTGAISNITDQVQPVPKLRGSLLDSNSREIFSWTFDPPTPELGAGEQREFATRVPNPPPGARGVAVTFVENGV